MGDSTGMAIIINMALPPCGDVVVCEQSIIRRFSRVQRNQQTLIVCVIGSTDEFTSPDGKWSYNLEGRLTEAGRSRNVECLPG